MDKVEQRVRFIASVVYINCEKPISDIQEAVSPDIAVFIPDRFPLFLLFPSLSNPFLFNFLIKSRHSRFLPHVIWQITFLYTLLFVLSHTSMRRSTPKKGSFPSS